MAFDEYGAPQFGLNDVKLATWNSTDDYATSVDVPSVQAFGTDLNLIAAQLTGDDEITATASRAIGAQFTLRFGSLSIGALEVILGQSAVSSDTTPNQVKQLQIGGGDNMPYFGICGRALAEEGDGDTHVFIAKCKVASDTLQLAMMEYGSFMIPEMTVQAVSDATYDIVTIIEHETAEAVAIPPTNIQ